MSSIGNLRKYTFTRFAVKALLVVVSAFVLAAPMFFRDKNSLFYGFEAYFHISHGPISYLVSFFSYLFHIDAFLVARVLPIVLGILSLLLFFEILKILGFRYWTIVLSCLMLIFSPSFIFLFATLTDFAFVAFLLLLISYLLFRKKEVPALVVFYILPFFGFLNLALALFLLLFYSLNIRRFRLFLYALPSLALLVFSTGKTLYSFGSFISDFGGPFGLGIFVIILSIFGLGFFWKNKYAHFYFYLAIILLCVLSFFNLRVLSYLNFFLALLAALGLEALFERHWKSKLIKSLTVMILIIGLFFSGLSYSTSVVKGLPNNDVLDALYALRDLPQGTVFSQVSREYWVDFAGKPFVGGNDLLYTRDIDNATSIINSKQVSYIWIDKDMKSMIWVEEDQGLLFLLKYSKRFEEIYSNDYVGIWKFNNEVVE